MKILLVEDEKIARDNLLKILANSGQEIEVVGQISSVKESIEWFKQGHIADLAFFDIRLNDGISFEIFENCSVECPVVFVSSYDEYLMNTFNCNGIDYILKPYNQEKIFESLNKYEKLKAHFSSETNASKISAISSAVKNRIIVRKGNYFVSLDIENIAYIVSENKLSFIITHDNNKYISDLNLGELDNMLDRTKFFRANRQYIVNIAAISRFKPHFKGKVLLELMPSPSEEVSISQENASKFRVWIGG